jgi:DNA-binding response OmpR family regulator
VTSRVVEFTALRPRQRGTEQRSTMNIGAAAKRRGSIVLGNLQINRDTFHVSVASRLVLLGAQEFDLVELLALQPDSIASFDDLTQYLWQEEGHRFQRRLAVLVYRLRSKLAGSFPYRIEMARGRGYGLISLEETNMAPGEGAIKGSRR